MPQYSFTFYYIIICLHICMYVCVCVLSNFLRGLEHDFLVKYFNHVCPFDIVSIKIFAFIIIIYFFVIFTESSPKYCSGKSNSCSSKGGTTIMRYVQLNLSIFLLRNLYFELLCSDSEICYLSSQQRRYFCHAFVLKISIELYNCN